MTPHLDLMRAAIGGLRPYGLTPTQFWLPASWEDILKREAESLGPLYQGRAAKPAYEGVPIRFEKGRVAPQIECWHAAWHRYRFYNLGTAEEQESDGRPTGESDGGRLWPDRTKIILGDTED